jgi:hypothetical protein
MNGKLVGVSGLNTWGGRVYEEYLNELSGDRWHVVLRKMQTDPIIDGVLLAIEMLIRQVAWTVAPGEGDDVDRVALIDRSLHVMRDPWPLILAEILSFLTWGWSVLEKTYRHAEDGTVSWDSWSIRAQDTFGAWQFDDLGTPIAFDQDAPPLYRTVRIPLLKCLHFRTTARKGNPEGYSLLRNAYDPWYYATHIKKIEGIGVERDLAGLPVAYVPPELLDETIRTPAEASVYEAIRKIVTNIRRDEQEGIVWPLAFDEHGNPRYELKLLSTGGTRQFDTDKIIQRYYSQIAMSMLADFIMLGHEKVSSFALTSSKTSLFSTALGAWLDVICAVVNAEIPNLLRLNGMPITNPPKLTHSDIETLELGELGTYLDALTKAGFPLASGAGGDVLYRHLLDQAGLPQPAVDAVMDEEQAAPEEEAPPSPPPDTEQDEPAIAAETDPLNALIDDVLDEAFALAVEAE